MIVIAEQIFILAFIALIGYIAFKIKAVSNENNEGLVKIIVRITLPLLIFATFSGAEVSAEIMQSFPFIFFGAIVVVVVFFLLATVSAKLLKLDRENTALHKTHTMFGNAVFLGFPLLNAVFPGGEGLIYAAIFQFGHDCLIWTWGILILKKGAGKSEKYSFKKLFNPTTIAFLLGLTFLLLKIEIPEIVFAPINSVGHTTIYLSMIYIGIVLAQVNPKSLVSNFRSYMLSLNKLLLGPVILGSLFYLLLSLGFAIPEKAIIATVLQAAMPCMIIVAVIAKDMGLNSNQAVENIFVSTVLSFLTLPFVFYLANAIF